MGVLKELILTVFTLGSLAVLKKVNLTVSTLRGCFDLESPGFNSFILCKVVVVLKELIFTVSILGRCGSLERTDFNSFYFGRGWWS